MTLKIWLKIFLIVIFVSVPLSTAQYFLQKESIELALDIADKTTPQELLNRQMQLLKQVSKYDAENLNVYKAEFEAVVEAKIAREDLQLVKAHLVRNLLRQTVLNVCLVLAVFLVLSFFVSHQIVATFKKLLLQIQAQSSRLERMNSIESWQKIARVLVHELRAPITPIKLVCTDIEHKYESLQAHSFREYLREGAGLIQSQVEAVERLLESFTRFAKLPEVKKTDQSIEGFLESFIRNYAGFNSGRSSLTLDLSALHKKNLSFDPESLKHLFFNLMKNAVEANPNRTVEILISARQAEEKTWIQFKNTGAGIPAEVAKKMFELHASTKDNSESSNFGMGLTISKKIALDHGGDLYLVSAEENNVTFELELQNI